MALDLIENLARVGRRNRLFRPTAAHSVDLERKDVEHLLPHRDPFLFIDSITAVDLPGRAIAGRRYIDRADPLFPGHFPGNPIYPGVLQIETIGQLGLCLFSLLRNGRLTVARDDRARSVRSFKVHHAVFLAEIRPGDQLVVLTKVVDSDEFTGICAGQLLKDEAICSFAVMEAYFVDD
jgi:3-hydroxymyristoyl/3-hydroxydecanoyl-(acyl carrier protein) dehydratase